MEELVKKIAEKAGIPEDKARMAAEAATEFINERVAHTIDNQVASALKNMTVAIKAEVHEAVTGEPAETFFEKMGDLAEGAKEKIEDFAGDAKEKFKEFAKTAKGFFSSFATKKEEAPKEEEKKS